jgi:CHAT domain-containing protein
LPSVANLKALKSVAAGPSTRKPLVGFANPIMDPNQQLATADASSRTVLRGSIAKADRQVTLVRQATSIKSYWRGSSIDVTELRKLGSVPATETELNAVTASLPGSRVFVGAEATETAVKQVSLEDYRIVYFATHALVTGELGAGEPALVLSLPATPSPLDDGLLTASEVSLLKLNADWVVLSACNTGSTGKDGAEALSGLAQAFFYAGARSLLVSHWSVDDIVTAKLMTRTFETMSKGPKGGRARALQAAMLAVIADPSEKFNVRPSFWAPFFVVGAD